VQKRLTDLQSAVVVLEGERKKLFDDLRSKTTNDTTNGGLHVHLAGVDCGAAKNALGPAVSRKSAPCAVRVDIENKTSAPVKLANSYPHAGRVATDKGPMSATLILPSGTGEPNELVIAASATLTAVIVPDEPVRLDTEPSLAGVCVSSVCTWVKTY
jgi:hypothetical protein